MVTHEKEFRFFVSDIDSSERYVKFLNDISKEAGLDITPASLQTDADVEKFAALLAPRYAPKSIANYRSVMRKYVQMARALDLRD